MNIKLITLSLFVAINFNAQVFSMNGWNYDAAQMNNDIKQQALNALYDHVYHECTWEIYDLYYGNEALGVAQNEKEAIELSKRQVLNYLQNLDPAQVSDVEQHLMWLLQSDDEDVRESVDETIKEAIVQVAGD